MNFCFSRFGVWSDDFEFRSQDGGHLRDYFGIKYFFSDSHSFQMARVERSVSFLGDGMVLHTAPSQCTSGLLASKLRSEEKKYLLLDLPIIYRVKY